jgi:transposase
MKRFIEGEDRSQLLLLADCLDDYVSEDNPVRVIDAFIDELDLAALGFESAVPALTGRPAYHPATLLRLYLYGYVNQVQSCRRLEREAQRNVEVMWLAGRLAPDFKTIADFRRDNGEAIQAVCRQFVLLCRELGLLSTGSVAIDGSRFKASNTRDKNFTPNAIRRRMEQVDASIERYLKALDTADRQEDEEIVLLKSARLKDRIASLRRQMRQLQAMESAVEAVPDRQISLTDPDARAMATNGRGTGLAGYNVQAAVDTTHHLIVAHEVTNAGHDRGQLLPMAQKAKAEMDAAELTAFADRGYFKGEDILACETAGITAYVPKPLTSGAAAEGRFGKQDFVYNAASDSYRCPGGEKLTRRFSNIEHGMTLHAYWTTHCQACPLKTACTTGKERRIKRWEHEDVVEAMERRLDRRPGAMRLRRQTVEHVFGTIKAWMGAAHFRLRTLKKAATEMSLHVLAYNLKRVISIMGVPAVTAAIRAA